MWITKLKHVEIEIEKEGYIDQENSRRLFRESGLGDFFFQGSKAKGNVFDRLYTDALKRLRRIELVHERVEEHERENFLRFISQEDLADDVKDKLVQKSQQILNQRWNETCGHKNFWSERQAGN